MVMMISPSAYSKPAAIAAVCPQLRRKETTTTLSSFFWKPSSAFREPSALPSSTKTISYFLPSLSMTDFTDL